MIEAAVAEPFLLGIIEESVNAIPIAPSPFRVDIDRISIESDFVNTSAERTA